MPNLPDSKPPRKLSDALDLFASQDSAKVT